MAWSKPPCPVLSELGIPFVHGGEQSMDQSEGVGRSAVVEIIEPCHRIESWEAFSAEVVRAMRDMGLDAQMA